MSVRRLCAAALFTAAAVFAVPAVPGYAHGTPITPISRSAACAGNGTKTSTAACKAAKTATNGFIGAFDNLRIANVKDDRVSVPDGKLCSGGLDAYKGLDLPREDFPSTAVRSGQKLPIAYRGTIPHKGEFRIFLTKPGYDPTKRLTWDDLGSKPLASFTDPALTDGSYRMSVTLPQRTGRHMLYVVWETSSTPDTYYSCSDLVFPAAPAVKKTSAKPSVAPVRGSAAPATSPATTTSAEAAVEPAEETAAEPSVDPVLASADSRDDNTNVGHWLIGGALGVGLLTIMIALLSRRRRTNL
ncbi:lytic polysaccharide monooxygenase [Actinoplanes regularis]|uniref:Chitin-binding protein n=1 Tax=Actinoplanes regularis TaxID=52697 RepID=A0A238Y2D4_9ACTN|nr:lytic polysaccharide monooxygenase [Actinoplanes regularis]SNR65385.1 chitin-binding protein [Actinoplanes regularis]